jgi:hypothetical protein
LKPERFTGDESNGRQSWLTLLGFVERSTIIASLPSLGLLTLAGMTSSEHDLGYTEVTDLDIDPVMQDVLGNFDLVSISSYSAQMSEAYQLADTIRKARIPLVMGGCT